MLKQVLREKNGKISASRVLALSWGLGLLACWLYICILTGTLVLIPKETALVALGFGGLKMAQRFGENEKPTEASTPDK